MGISVPTTPGGGGTANVLQVARATATTDQALSGTPTIDDVALSATNRVLLTGQSSASENGLWVAAAGAWTRPSDYAAGATIQPNVVVPVAEGTTNGDTRWQITDDGAVVVDTDPTTWGKTNLGLVAVVDDLTPVLGGNLDCNTKSVTGAGELGVGTAVPDRKLDVLDSAGVSDAAVPQLRLTHTDGVNFAEVGSTADGYFLAQPSGGAGYSFFRGSANSYIVIQEPSLTGELTPASFPDTKIGLVMGVQAKVGYIWLDPALGTAPQPAGAAIKIGVEHSTLIIDNANGTKNVQVVGNATLGNDPAVDTHIINGNTTLNGQLNTRFPVIVKTGAATLLAAECNSIIHINNASGAPITIDLPAIAGCPAGSWFEFKDGGGNAGADTITIDASSTETIDSDLFQELTADYAAFRIYSDGTAWFVAP